MLLAPLAAGALALSAAGPALAFGEDGHRIAAELADRRLTPDASRAVRDLLAVESLTSLDQIASWADRVRNERRETAPWHYVDIPVSAAGYDAARDCPDGDCIVAKIEEYRDKLADESLSREERLEALKFVVHFVGDLHQPLHAADDHDKGGNAETVTGYSGARNLHAVWDAGILAAAGLGEPDAARKLEARISDADAAAWTGGSAADWANESHAIAVSFIYARRPDAEGRLPAGYQDAAEPIVERQLERAGVRLAAVIDDALDPSLRDARRARLAEVPPASPAAARGARDPACAIKGNVSEAGRIFHAPGQAGYAATRIDAARGERWFCTEAEAVAAGWRKARR